MSCWPACSAWCECVGDTCIETPVAINAVRFRTPDGRYLHNSNPTLPGGSLLDAVNVATPSPTETFLFVAPATWPLLSGNSISLDVCNATWAPSGFLVRVEHTYYHIPPDKKSEGLIGVQIGGPNARVWVTTSLNPFFTPSGIYKGDDPAEWTFEIVKMVGGAAASPGTPINSGDRISLRINSRSTWLFRVTGGQSGAVVNGDGTALGQAGTVFTAEFNEVRSGLGWRPSVIKCQSCAVVTAKVTRAGTVNAIAGAMVKALPPSQPFSGTSGNDGRATLVATVDGAPRNCIPDGNVQLQASADRHQTKTVTVSVPDSGSLEVPIQLECTQVKGKVVDSAGNGLPGVTVRLRDKSHPSPKTILDENGNPYVTTTAADGTFVFNCVAHDYVQVFTTADSSQTQHTKDKLPPEGWTNVTITVQTACGDLVGTVTDAATGQPIAGATVTEAGGRTTTTDANGRYTFTCVKPAGEREVYASAPGYSEGSAIGIVPTTGNSSSVDIKLKRIAVMAFKIRLDWGTQPSDLDSHLSGPNPAGGRFHLFYANRGAPPVPFVELDLDDTTALGPETITIRRSPATAAGVFEAGDYHYWVHNFTATFDEASTFVGSGAAVSVLTVDASGNLSEIGRYEVVNATGTEDDLWHVVDLAIDANGNFALNVVQTFQPGNQDTVL